MNVDITVQLDSCREIRHFRGLTMEHFIALTDHYFASYKVIEVDVVGF